MNAPRFRSDARRPASARAMLGSGCALVVLGFLACNGETTDASGTGGSEPATGGSENASGGAPTTGGSAAAGEGGMQGGGAGAPTLPDCGCGEDSAVTVDFLAGTRVYDLVAEHIDHCNPLECQPETAYATYAGAPPSYFGIRACHADGDCISIRTGFIIPDTNDGDIRFTAPGAEPGEGDVEPILIDAEVKEASGRDVLEFSFETDESETDAVLAGSGRVCLASTQYICLK